MQKSLNQESKCHVQKTSNTNFNLSKNSLSYLLSINIVGDSININSKLLFSPTHYEGIFTIDDLLLISRVFYSYENLQEIYQSLIDKLTEEKVDICEEDKKFLLKFDISLDSKKKDIALVLNKNSESDLSKVIDEISRTVLYQAELLKVSNLKISNLEERILALEKKKMCKDLDNSKIVKKEEIPMIKKWIDSSNFQNIKFKLIFRASKHGKSYSSFHFKCDGKSDTIVFITSNTNKRFGGYSDLTWDSTGSTKTNPKKSFLFSLDEKKSFNSNSVGIYCSPSYGPTFYNNNTGYNDILISSNFDGNSTLTYTAAQILGVNSQYSQNQNVPFTPQEVEVYRILY